MDTTRTRWAAIGAAIAITLGGGGIGVANATSDASDGPVSAFFPIEPCRLADNAAITADSSIGLNGWARPVTAICPTASRDSRPTSLR